MKRPELARLVAILLLLSGGVVGALRVKRILPFSWWILAPIGVVVCLLAAGLFVYWDRNRARPRHSSCE